MANFGHFSLIATILDSRSQAPRQSLQFSGFQGRALEPVGGDRREVSNFGRFVVPRAAFRRCTLPWANMLPLHSGRKLDDLLGRWKLCFLEIAVASRLRDITANFKLRQNLVS